MKTLLVISREAATDPAEGSAREPTPHHVALARILRAHHGDTVDVIDHAAAVADTCRSVRVARRAGGLDAALAMLAYLRAAEYDAILSFGEAVAVPLAALMRPMRRRPGHVCVTSRLSAVRRRLFFTIAKAHSAVDTLFVYSQAQRDYAEDVLRIPCEKLALICYPVDDVFFRPAAGATVNPRQICAVGSDRRDYHTLQEAAKFPAGMTVVLAQRSEEAQREILSLSLLAQDKLDIPARDAAGIRALYTESAIVAVPLRDCDYEAGAHTIVEAMAMGKPIIATQTLGQTDAIADGITGLCVTPGDVAGWRRAIDALRHDAELRDRLGRNARRWIEVNSTLDRWVNRIAEALREAADESARTSTADASPAALYGSW
jgi:glycosyltransferase involved in cell wall biosynthesis